MTWAGTTPGIRDNLWTASFAVRDEKSNTRKNLRLGRGRAARRRPIESNGNRPWRQPRRLVRRSTRSRLLELALGYRPLGPVGVAVRARRQREGRSAPALLGRAGLVVRRIVTSPPPVIQGVFAAAPESRRGLLPELTADGLVPVVRVAAPAHVRCFAVRMAASRGLP